MIATFGPKILIKRTREPRSTIGDDIRNENVTPKGRPADVKPIKRGIEEQEQKDTKYEEHLQKEVPESEYSPFVIDKSLIPDGLHPVGMEGVLHFIKKPGEKTEPAKKKLK